jgi:hypothetical protein
MNMNVALGSDVGPDLSHRDVSMQCQYIAGLSGPEDRPPHLVKKSEKIGLRAP